MIQKSYTPTSTVRQSDVATLDAILHAFYETVSGAVGQPRDWARFRSLILPGGRLMPVVSIAGEKAGVRFLSTEDFIQRVEPIFAVEDFSGAGNEPPDRNVRPLRTRAELL